MLKPGSMVRLGYRAISGLTVAYLLTTNAWASADTLRYFPSGPIYEYRWKLLELALQRGAEPGLIPALQPALIDASQNRGVRQLERGELDVIALGISPERRTRLLPIKIDILQGIVGYRIFIIRSEDEARLRDMDAQDLRSLSYGLNAQWADVAVMRANGFKVEPALGYDNLFSMLDARRFDVFPRGLNEASREIEMQHARHPNLIAETTKALYFPYPIYFWVNKDNKALANQIERGLKAALADGSMRRLFERYHAREIASMKARNRQVLMVKNPLLLSDSEHPDTRWWWKQR